MDEQIVRTTVEEPLGGTETLDELRAAESPTGETLSESVTVPLKLFTLATVIVDEAQEPC